MNNYLLKQIPIIAILLLVCGFARPLIAQDTLRLTLQDAIQMVLVNGGEARAERFDSSAFAAKWRSARDLWWPQLTFDATLYDYSKNWSRLGPYYRSVQNAQLNLNQKFAWGGSVRVWQNLGLYKIDYDDTLYTNLVSYSGRRGVEYAQPLLSGNPVGRERESARLTWESNLLAHEIRVREIKYDITSSFFGLLQAQASYDISKQDLESGRSSADLAERKLAAGFIPEVELLQIQVDLARREASNREVESNFETMSDDFRRKLGLPPTTVAIPLFDAWSDTVLPAAPPPPNLEDRPDIRQRMLQLRMSELGMKNSIAGKRADLSLNVGYSASGVLSDRATNALKNVNTEDSYFAFSLSMPIFGFGTTTADIDAARYSFRSTKISYQIQLEQAAVNQREAYRRLEQSADRIRISDKALDLSLRSFSITEERFSNGLVSSRDLLDAQLDLTRTRNEAVRARIDYYLSLAGIERFTPGDEVNPHTP